MTDTEIDLPDNTLSQQLGQVNIYIQKLLPLSISSKSSVDKKMKEIFETLRAHPDLPDNHRQIIEHLIDACKCKEYTHTRFLSLYDRTVIKTTHTNH